MPSPVAMVFTSVSGARFAHVADNACLVSELFPHSSTYLGDPERQTAMVNILVDDVYRIVERLVEYGATVEPIDDEPNDRFSWATDPESNLFERWEPTPT